VTATASSHDTETVDDLEVPDSPDDTADDTAGAGLPAGLDPHTLRAAFGAFPSGVVAVAAQVRGQLVGIAASSFTSVSLDPPLISFSVATTSQTWPVLRDAPHLGISVLADHHDDVCRQLAGPTEQRFTGLPVRSTGDGAVLLEEAVATFDCSIRDEVEAGDHVIVVLELHAVSDSGVASPLVFHRSGFKKLSADDLDQSKLQGRINGKRVDVA
jgi:flavin reductase (DIM6/NTAB) family NADH-FMN oxidoreductase RutF